MFHFLTDTLFLKLLFRYLAVRDQKLVKTDHFLIFLMDIREPV